MAEQLDDGEFWLPSHFLTDDDILIDFSLPLSNSHSSFGFGSGSSSDLASLTESSDDDDLLLLLRPCPIHSKGSMLSTSPQSTLCGCVCNHQGSSRGSPISPPKEESNGDKKKEKGNATLDLLNKAAGEVAKIKLRSETKSTGTGFFDCSSTAKGLLCPPTPPPPTQQQSQPPPQPLRNPNYFPPFYTHPPQFHRFPPVMWTPPPFQRPPQNRVPPKNNANGKSNNAPLNNTRPLGLPPSAWPPLPGQVQAQPQPQPQAQPMFVGPKRDSVGTGVFLPRQVNTPSDSRKKSDGNTTKTKNNKVSQRRSNKGQSTSVVKDDEIQLPSEWIY